MDNLTERDRAIYRGMQNQAILQAAFDFGKHCAKEGYPASANPHSLNERWQLEVWLSGYESAAKKTRVSLPSGRNDS